MITHDVTIVGAGPVGLATAIFARNAGLSVQVLDGGAIDLSLIHISEPTRPY